MTIFNNNSENHNLDESLIEITVISVLMRHEKLLWFCTCTALELMTATGVTAYLLYLGQTTIALISGIVFAKVIGFHFIIEIHERLKKGKTILKS